MPLESFDAAVSALRQARRMVALTGAGISRESGLPTFREAGSGLWARYRPEDLATPEAFARDPELVWRWYAWRRSLVAAAEPNPAHYALVRLERHALHFTLVTQNVDALHRRAGSTEVIELHGDITKVRCAGCGAPAAGEMLPEDAPPRCRCGSLFRPGVVWFGEQLPHDALERATLSAAEADLFLVIGTSGLVYPAAGLSGVAARSGAMVISINPDPGSAPPGALPLTGSATEILPRLVDGAWPGAPA